MLQLEFRKRSLHAGRVQKTLRYKAPQVISQDARGRLDLTDRAYRANNVLPPWLGVPSSQQSAKLPITSCCLVYQQSPSAPGVRFLCHIVCPSLDNQAPRRSPVPRLMEGRQFDVGRPPDPASTGSGQVHRSVTAPHMLLHETALDVMADLWVRLWILLAENKHFKDRSRVRLVRMQRKNVPASGADYLLYE
jgi:hypothetical protein